MRIVVPSNPNLPLAITLSADALRLYIGAAFSKFPEAANIATTYFNEASVSPCLNGSPRWEFVQWQDK